MSGSHVLEVRTSNLVVVKKVRVRKEVLLDVLLGTEQHPGSRFRTYLDFLMCSRRPQCVSAPLYKNVERRSVIFVLLVSLQGLQ